MKLDPAYEPNQIALMFEVAIWSVSTKPNSGHSLQLRNIKYDMPKWKGIYG